MRQLPDQKELFTLAKKMYDLRSRIAHGDSLGAADQVIQQGADQLVMKALEKYPLRVASKPADKYPNAICDELDTLVVAGVPIPFERRLRRPACFAQQLGAERSAIINRCDYRTRAAFNRVSSSIMASSFWFRISLAARTARACASIGVRTATFSRSVVKTSTYGRYCTWLTSTRSDRLLFQSMFRRRPLRSARWRKHPGHF